MAPLCTIFPIRFVTIFEIIEVLFRCFAKVTDTASSAYFKVQFEDQMRKQMDKAIKVLTSQPVSLISTDPSATTTSPREQKCKVREQNEYGANSDSHVMSKGFDEVLWVHAFPFPLKSRVYRLELVFECIPHFGI